MSSTTTQVLSVPPTLASNRAASPENERITLHRTFNQRAEDLAHEFANAHLEIQGEIHQFIQKLNETDSENQKRISSVLCILLTNVIGNSLCVAPDDDIQRKRSLLLFYNQFKELLQEVQPEGVLADDVLNHYMDLKKQKEIQDQRLIDITEIAAQKLEEACQFANSINHSIVRNFEVLIGGIKALSQKRQTLQQNHQRKLDELSARAYAAFQEVLKSTQRQGQLDRDLKADEQDFDKTLQSVEGLLDRLQRL